jgi:uncharacterized protein (UPF0333 family)
MRNKGQTAMEYLMTYGWAILIIIVVVAALYAMGVFSIKGGVACSPCFNYFAFRDYTKGAGGTTDGILYVRNGARTVSVVTNKGTPSATSCGVDCSANKCEAGADIEIDGLDGSVASFDITLTYTDCDSTAAHDDTATIHNK